MSDAPKKRGSAFVCLVIALALFAVGIAGMFAQPRAGWPRPVIFLALAFNTAGLFLRIRERRGG